MATPPRAAAQVLSIHDDPLILTELGLAIPHGLTRRKKRCGEGGGAGWRSRNRSCSSFSVILPQCVKSLEASRVALARGGMSKRKDPSSIRARSIVGLHVNAGTAISERINRQIDRLEIRITRLRRAIRDVNANAPSVPQELPPQNRTQPVAEPSIENKDVTGQTAPENHDPEPPIYITERNPLVIAAYRREFPNRKIILLPADDVAKGIDIDDDMPDAPRRAR